MHEYQARTILNKSNNMCIYNGCSNNCVYCKQISRAHSRDRTDVGIKTNALELLDLALRKKRKKCILHMSSYSDPYQSLERSYKLTRDCLELIEKKEFGVTIRTKSELLLRDIDLLERINHRTKAVVMLSLSSLDDKLIKKLEPNAATASKRLMMFKTLKKANIPVIAVIEPILPFVTDNEQNFLNLIRELKQIGVTGILNTGFGITLDNSSRFHFFNQLDSMFPEIYALYLKTYGYDYALESLNAENLNKIFERELNHSKILSSPEEIFKYLRDYRNKAQGTQISFF